MCVIIHKPKGIEFSPEDVRGAFESNSHGFGVMYRDEETGTIIAKKKLTKDVPAIQKIFADLKDEDAVFHFRIKTHGPTNSMFCHPFQVLNKKKHGRDMWMMHNGMINKAGNSPNESDTYAYVRNVLTPLFEKDIDLLQFDWLREKVEQDIGGSKLVFLSDDGTVVKYNEKYGDTYKGCWVSNKGFVASTHTSYRQSWGSRQSKHSDYGSDYDDNFPYKGRETKSETGNNVTVIGPNAMVTLRGVTLKPGSKVHIYAVNDPSFYAIGTVSAVGPHTFHVGYTDPNDNSIRTAMFYPGGMTTDAAVRKLQVLPESFGIEQRPRSFIETRDWPKQITSTKETKDMVTDQKKDEETEVITDTDDEEVPFGTAVTHEGNPLLEYVGTKPIELMMEAKDCRYGGGEIDSFDVYGGKDEECEEITLLDIYNLEPQERMNWFFNHPNVAFGIFQDLVEQLVLDDPEVIHEGDEEEETEIEDTSVEESRTEVA